MILFLDYDGVLHPDAAYLVNRRPVLRAEGKLFMWANVLVDVLADYPHVSIVLSTSWARELRFSRARDYLPPDLRSRVIGATWHSVMGIHPEGGYRLERPTWWDEATRYQQIRRYVDRARLTTWVAVADHPEGWADDDRHRLIQTDSMTGLSAPTVLAQLMEKLKAN